MEYIASERETFDEIAFRIYGDEKYSYLLLGANPQQSHKIMMEGGETLIAPELTEETDGGLPPWKRGA